MSAWSPVCYRVTANLHTVLSFQISLFQVSVTDFEQLICSGSVRYKFAEMQSPSESDVCY